MISVLIDEIIPLSVSIARCSSTPNALLNVSSAYVARAFSAPIVLINVVAKCGSEPNASAISLSVSRVAGALATKSAIFLSTSTVVSYVVSTRRKLAARISAAFFTVTAVLMYGEAVLGR